jgi:type II secretory pathway pseudopilin PulG
MVFRATTILAIGKLKLGRSNAARGMTLVEICLAVAILALVGGVVSSSFENIGRVQLHKSLRGLRAVVRRSYVDAALEGQTYRLSLESGKGSILVEKTEDELRFNAGKQQFEDIMGLSNNQNPNATTEAAGPTALAQNLILGDMAQGSAKPSSYEKVGTFELEKGVKILDVWLEGAAKPETKLAYLFFFPGGYSMGAIINIEDASKKVQALKIGAVSGTVEILNGYQQWEL